MLLLFSSQTHVVPWEVPCAHMLHAVCCNRCHHTTTFPMVEMQPHGQSQCLLWKAVWVPLVQCTSKIHGVLHKHSSVLLRFRNSCFLRSRNLSWVWFTLAFLSFDKLQMQKWISQKKVSKFILTCEMFLIIPLLLSNHSKKIGRQFPVRKICLAEWLPFKIKITQCWQPSKGHLSSARELLAFGEKH